MDLQPIGGQPRKAGVDYGKCQAEFDAQMLLLKEDLKKRLNLAQNEHEGRKISNISRSFSLVGKFLTLVFDTCRLGRPSIDPQPRSKAEPEPTT